MASEGSDPPAFLAAVSDSTSSIRTLTWWGFRIPSLIRALTRQRGFSISLLISVNIFWTSLPDSENHWRDHDSRDGESRITFEKSE